MRDLLFDGVVEAEAEAEKNWQPRVWGSVFDIPKGTLVKPAGDPGHLYITTTGNGWWGRDQLAVDDAERTGGWNLRNDHDQLGPFTEVRR